MTEQRAGTVLYYRYKSGHVQYYTAVNYSAVHFMTLFFLFSLVTYLFLCKIADLIDDALNFFG